MLLGQCLKVAERWPSLCSCQIAVSHVHTLRRTPIAVESSKSDSKKSQSPKMAKNAKNQKVVKKPGKLQTDGVLAKFTRDDGISLKYTTLKDAEAGLQYVKSILQVRTKPRHQHRSILLEGIRLISDALLAQGDMTHLYFTHEKFLEELPISESDECKLFKIPEATVHVWSTLEAPPGVLAIFRQPTMEEVRARQQQAMKISILVDNVRIPNNMGAIVRTAAAAGCHRLIVTPGNVDPWSEKVVQTGMGSHFRLPILHPVTWNELITGFETQNIHLLLADSNSYQEHLAADEEDVSPPFARHLPLVDYAAATYPTDREILFLLAGETGELSEGAQAFIARQSEGQRVHITMGNNVNSLNVGTALGILLFEIRKQLVAK